MLVLAIGHPAAWNTATAWSVHDPAMKYWASMVMLVSCGITPSPVDESVVGEYCYEFSRFARMNLDLRKDGTYALTWDGCTGFST